MIAPQPVPVVPEIRDMDEFEQLRWHVVAYDALARLVLVLSGVQSGDVDEVVIDKAMREARHAADGLGAAFQEMGYRHGVMDVRDALYDWRGRSERAA